MLKYCETAYDRKIREAREDEASKVTKKVTESIACNLLRENSDINYVHEMTNLPVSKIKELKANL